MTDKELNAKVNAVLAFFFCSAFIVGGIAAMFGNLTLTIFCSAIIITTGLAKGYDEE